MDFMVAINQIPAGVYSLLGVIVGFCLNFAKERYDNRARLYFSLGKEIPYEGWSYDKMDKTGPSGYVLEMYNCGKNHYLSLMLQSGLPQRL